MAVNEISLLNVTFLLLFRYLYSILDSDESGTLTKPIVQCKQLRILILLSM
jgi:hypothetical protein